MNAKSIDPLRACAVCDASDARMLIAVPLATGETTVLCGSHALMYRRGGTQLASIDELRARLSDRRAEPERRGVASPRLGERDELSAKLTEAFAGDRRQSTDRRAR